MTEVDFRLELEMANQILQEKLGIHPNNFVYPYGRFNATVHQHARQIHRYVHRIGNALNRGWEGSVLYRVDANRFWVHQKPITQADIRGLFYRYWWNRIRRK
jgi:peptidoglycan/xylan/chitin deacetylase (PgdA/CDA1 family)